MRGNRGYGRDAVATTCNTWTRGGDRVSASCRARIAALGVKYSAAPRGRVSPHSIYLHRCRFLSQALLHHSSFLRRTFRAPPCTKWPPAVSKGQQRRRRRRLRLQPRWPRLDLDPHQRRPLFLRVPRRRPTSPRKQWAGLPPLPQLRRPLHRPRPPPSLSYLWR